jgi:spermidine synthase
MPQMRFYGGLFFITAGTLMLQILQTRILSVVAWYHLAFFAISMAMFGLTAGAVFVYLRGERFTECTLSYDLSYFSAAFALATVVCLAVQMTLAPVVTWSMTAVWTWLELAICMAVPFFFSGIVVSLALTRSSFPIGRVYGVDLLGAAAGCLGALWILNSTDGPSGIIWVGAVIAAAALLFAGSGLGHEPGQRPPLHGLLSSHKSVFGILVVVALANGASNYGLQPLVSKGTFEGGNSYVFREWNTFSRIVVGRTRNAEPFLWGPSPKLMRSDYVIDQRVMNIDGDAGTIALRFTGEFEKVDFLKYDVTNLAYFLPDRARAAVIGVGGGRDILSAATFGYRDITGVELNPVFVKLLRDEPGFSDFTSFEKLEGVRLEVDEGRSWFARSDQSFDIIQMSLIDTWAATGAGAFSLSENGLYTVEAWKVFLDRLTEKGVYAVSRWFNSSDPSEAARTVSLAVAALLERGVAEPRQHIVLATQGRIATLLVAREPFSQEDLQTLQRVAAQYEHRILVSPLAKSDEPIVENIVATEDRESLEEYTSSLAFDLTPPTDNRPFFFNQVRPSNPVQALRIARQNMGGGAELGGVRQGNLVATATLLVLFFVSLLLVVTTIVVPLRPAIKDVGRRLAFGGTLYFSFIGLGFMLVEIGLMQRTSVFLGHPVYSLSVLLFTLILSTGIGSLLSDLLPLKTRARFTVWALLTAAYIMGLPLWFANVFPAFDGSRLLIRALLCVAIMAPAGLLMGFAFPTGMNLISLVDRRPTPWFWGVNGAAGVLASIVAIVCSIAFGIGATLLVGAAFYLLLIPTALFFLLPAAHTGNHSTRRR